MTGLIRIPLEFGYKVVRPEVIAGQGKFFANFAGN